jgi:hypothetical protein
MMRAMAAVDDYSEDDDETVTRPLTRENLPRYALTGSLEVEALTQPLATRRMVPQPGWSAWSSPTNEMPILPARSETTVTRPMPKLPERMDVRLPPLPQAPRAKLDSGFRLKEEAERELPPMPKIPRPSLQSDVPLPSLRPPRPRLASVGLRPLHGVDGPRFERAPALPTPPMFPEVANVAPDSSEDIEVAPAFRMATPVPAVATPVPAPAPVPFHTPTPPPNVILSSFESSAHTKRTTLPPMQHPVGLPVMPTYPMPASLPQPQRLLARPSPIPWLQNTSANRVLSSPFFLLAFAVSLIAMSILGFTAVASSASESRRAARTRTITADDIAGGSVTDATVFVDGTPRCNALPCTLELKDGTHWITVRAAGYDTPPSRTVKTGKEEPANVHFGLARVSNIPLPPGTVVVQPVPSPASSPVAVPVPVAAAPVPSPVVGPQYAAPSPVAPQAAAPLALSEPVATPVANPIPVAAAAPAAPAAPAIGQSTLNINSLPVSSIVLDGRPLGQTPKLRVPVKPGNHTVMFIRKGKRVVRGARVGMGESVTVSARLD